MKKYNSLFGFHTEVLNNSSLFSIYKEEIAVLTLSSKESNYEILFPIEMEAISILIVERGDCRMGINYTSYCLSQNMFIVLREGLFISNVTFSEDFIGHVIIVKNNFLRSSMGFNVFPVKDLFNRRLHSHAIKIGQSDFERVMDYVKQLKCNISLHSHLYQYSLIQNALCNINLELWNITAQVNLEDLQQEHTPTIREKLTFQFIHMVHVKCKTNHEVASYARDLNVSAAHLTRALKELTGKTASEWITENLLSEIKLLLHYPENTIQFIASETNFSDQASLCKFFKKNAGMSPSEYKKKVNKII